MYEHFIKKKHEVSEEDKSRTFRPATGPARKPRNVVLCGLEGSGRMALAREVASRLDLDIVMPEKDAEDFAGLAEGEGRLVVVGPEYLAEPEYVARIPRMGHVFFLMADVPFLVQSRRLTDDERERLAGEFPELEMRFHALGGFPLSSYRPIEENAAQIAEVLEMGA